MGCSSSKPNVAPPPAAPAADPYIGTRPISSANLPPRANSERNLPSLGGSARSMRKGSVRLEKGRSFRHGSTEDLSPNEIVKMLSPTSEAKTDGEEEEGGSAKPGEEGEIENNGLEALDEEVDDGNGGKFNMKFVSKFVASLIPTPQNMADLVSGATPEAAGYDATASALATHNLTRWEHARALNRRPSATATVCQHPDCSTYHFRLCGFCPEHDEFINKAIDIPTVLPAVNASTLAEANGGTAPPSKSDDQQLKELQDYMYIAELRRQMIGVRDTYYLSHPPELTEEAKKLWYPYAANKYGRKDDGKSAFSATTMKELALAIGNNNCMPLLELTQLLYQFRRLNVSQSGTIRTADLRELVATYVDPEWVVTEDSAVVEEKLAEWITSSKQGILSNNRGGRVSAASAAASTGASMTFPEYVDSLLRLRESEWETSAFDLLATGFWDLRMIILFMPPAETLSALFGDHVSSKHDNFWLYKKGDFFAKRFLNSWKRRYFTGDVEHPKVFKHGSTGNAPEAAAAGAPSGDPAPTHSPVLPSTAYTHLSYWDSDNLPEDKSAFLAKLDLNQRATEGSTVVTSTAAASSGGVRKPANIKGAITLLDVLLVNFSPADTIQPDNKSITCPQLCFEVGVRTGRQYVLAASDETAFKWAAFFSCYEQVGVMISDWRDDWGSKRKYKVTMRDYINGGSVMSKIMSGKKTEAEYAKKIEAATTEKEKEELRKKLAVEMEDLKVTARDKFYLEVIGLTVATATLESSADMVLKGVEAVYSCRRAIHYVDKNYLMGIGSATISGIVTSVLAYKYVEKFNNRRKQNKYGVIWTPDEAVTCCAVCGFAFKTFTVRKNMRRHHCRLCGKVVCHSCSAKLVYMESTKSYERMCKVCVIAGETPADVSAKFDGPEKAKEAIKQQHKKAVEGAKAAAVSSAKKQVKGAVIDQAKSAVDA